MIDSKSRKTLETLTERLFPGLRERFQPQAIYAISGNDSTDLAGRFLSCILSGAIPLPLPPSHPWIKRGGMVVPWPGPKPNIPEGAAYGCQTSGSTGPPKVVFFSLERALINAEMHANSIGVHSGSVLIQSLPLHHSFGLVAYLFTAAVKNCALVFQKAPFDWLTISDKNCVLHLTPDHLVRALRMSPNWPKDLTVSVGAAMSRAEDMFEMGRYTCNLFTTYGLTEAGPRVATGRWRPGNVNGYFGAVFPGIESRIGNSDESHAGELQIRTPCLALDVAPERLTQDRFFRTGDRVRQLENGDLIFLHRLDRSFNWRGRLYQMDSIFESARKSGISTPAILFAPGETNENLQLYITQESEATIWHELFTALSLAVPQIKVIMELPRDSMGKIIGGPLQKSTAGQFFIME